MPPRRASGLTGPVKVIDHAAEWMSVALLAEARSKLSPPPTHVSAIGAEPDGLFGGRSSMGSLHTSELPASVRPTPARRSAPRRNRLLLFGVGFLVVVTAGVIWQQSGGYKASDAPQPDPAQPAASATADGQAIHVDVIRPRQGGMKRVSTQPGTVHAFDHADLFAKISGYLKEQRVDIGDRVKKGQVLAVIDDPEVIEDAARAEAQWNLAKAQALQAQARIRSAEAGREAVAAQVEQAKADVERYNADLRYRDSSYARIANLFKQHAVDEKLVDEERDRRDASRAALHSAQAAVITAQAQLAEADAKVEQAKADLEAAKQYVEVDASNLAKARVFVNYTKIVAPFDGVITHRNFHAGDLIQSATDSRQLPLLRVARTDLMRVIVQVPDMDAPYTDPGDPAVLTIATLGNAQFVAKVSRVADSQDADTRTMRTEIDIPKPSGKLREGMYGTAEITLTPTSDNLSIPSLCLVNVSENGAAFVYVVRDGKAHLVPVKIGADNGLEVEILSGLRPDDEVIANHSGTIADGQPVDAKLVQSVKAN
jgi:HlyD family secretion protein